MKWKNLSENELLDSLRQGSTQAVSEIYRRFWNKLLAIAVNHLNDADDAEDAVQNVFIKLWDNRETVEIRNLSAYLATAVKYTVFSALRSKKKFSNLEELSSEENHDKDEQAEKIYLLFLKDYLDGVTEKLPDKCRLVFQLSRDKGLTNREIAQELSVSEKTVEAHMSRALKTIRGALKNGGILPLLYLGDVSRIYLP